MGKGWIGRRRSLEPGPPAAGRTSRAGRTQLQPFACLLGCRGTLSAVPPGKAGGAARPAPRRGRGERRSVTDVTLGLWEARGRHRVTEVTAPSAPCLPGSLPGRGNSCEQNESYLKKLGFRKRWVGRHEGNRLSILWRTEEEVGGKDIRGLWGRNV